MTQPPHYDIVIIGAGIQGAGVAQAAAAFGYRTLIIEKFPQAGMGTSSKSSKLIHGGLRYLESGQFSLVKECLIERKHLLKNAPDLVKLTAFYIPVYSHSLRPAWMIWAGLLIYSALSLKPFSIIKKSAWHKLKLKNIKTIFKYYDAQTDDKKLTQAVVNSALKQGAKIVYHAEFIKSCAQNDSHHLIYKKGQQHINIKCSCIVNCSGPWLESTQSNISPALNIPAVEFIAGTHIIVNRTTKKGIYYVEAKDKRAVFIMPWKNKHTLIGTTERKYTGSADNITPTSEEKTYLLETYNRYFESAISDKNIIDSFAGIRVLPADSKSSFNKSRDSIIIHNSDRPGLITLIGGKLTAYRASSEEVLLQIEKILGPPENANRTDTRNIRL